MADTIDRKPWRIMLWGAAALLLLAPAVAMQFTHEVNWGSEDFVVFGAMLLALCLALEAVMRLIRRPAWRAIAGLAAVAVFLATWAHLAVGIW